MNKDISLQIKGIAILFMIWLHCFADVAVMDLYVDFSLMGEKTCSILARLTNPVQFFIILSGYGLYMTYAKTHTIQVWQRTLKLYLLFFLVFVIYIPLGCYLKPDIYPNTIGDFIQNIMTWNTTYNRTWWFLFPYIIVLLCSNWIFKVFEQYSLFTLGVCTTVYVLCYTANWLSYHDYTQIPYAIHQCLVTLDFLFPFCIGATFAKYNVIDRIRSYYQKKPFILIAILCAIIGLRLATSIDFFVHTTYTVAIIIAYAILPHFQITKDILQRLGKHSASMWFIHAFYLYYFFTDYIYALKYPLLIYCAITIISYFSAYIIDYANQLIQKSKLMNQIYQKL